jgi:hypothetical protein
MQVYVISSEVSSTPLAEIRTDGKRIEFLVDNTNGKLPKTVQGSMDRLKQIVENSSHLKMTQPKEATAEVLRYIMTNGDIVEITTDGKTAELNGELLSEDEKKALFEAIRSGELSIARKADTSKPIPVLPKPAPSGPSMQDQQAQQDQQDNVGKFDVAKVNDLKDYQEQQRKERNRGNKNFDETIEKSVRESNEDDKGFLRHIMYALKYGSRGE